MNSDQIDTLNERMGRFEKECVILKRRAQQWRLAGGLAVLGAIVLTLGGARPADDVKVVEAERFVVKDKDGKERIRTGIEPDGTAGQIFLDKEGKPRLCLGVGPNGMISIEFIGEQGKTRLSLDVDPDGTTEVTGYGKDGDKPRIAIGIQDGLPYHSLFDKDGKQRIDLYLDPDGEPGLRLMNKEGGIRSHLP